MREKTGDKSCRAAGVLDKDRGYVIFRLTLISSCSGIVSWFQDLWDQVVFACGFIDMLFSLDLSLQASIIATCNLDLNLNTEAVMKTIEMMVGAVLLGWPSARRHV